ncbi:hypothetical protein DFH29DRAFT_1039703, partial [Suillus ampliporus]
EDKLWRWKEETDGEWYERTREHKGIRGLGETCQFHEFQDIEAHPDVHFVLQRGNLITPQNQVASGHEVSGLRDLHGSRFIFATESYGGHYGPSFVTYFEEQNALIASRAIDAISIVVSALMINNFPA